MLPLPFRDSQMAEDFSARLRSSAFIHIYRYPSISIIIVYIHLLSFIINDMQPYLFIFPHISNEVRWKQSHLSHSEKQSSQLMPRHGAAKTNYKNSVARTLATKRYQKHLSLSLHFCSPRCHSFSLMSHCGTSSIDTLCIATR